MTHSRVSTSSGTITSPDGAAGAANVRTAGSMAARGVNFTVMAIKQERERKEQSEHKQTITTISQDQLQTVSNFDCFRELNVPALRAKGLASLDNISHV